jgi:hypothetical protein
MHASALSAAGEAARVLAKAPPAVA